MTGNDDTILEYLHDRDVALPPKGLDINLSREGVQISYSTINRRLGKLEDRDMVEKVDEKRGYYVITDKGRAYLNEELGPDELEDPDDE